MTTVCAMSQAFAVAERAGVDRQQLFDIMSTRPSQLALHAVCKLRIDGVNGLWVLSIHFQFLHSFHSIHPGKSSTYLLTLESSYRPYMADKSPMIGEQSMLELTPDG